ncbi:hypothetical protein QQX98_005506 [Neonectria punicea]|uniref:Beta-lactamase-related domain-containing protein n=1 Tax=Neonectria punicea TaxID=979145 RepID=A0ABR1H4C0_9HYPO
MYGFLGMEGATHIAEELPNPERTVPKVIMMIMAIGTATSIPWTIAMMFSTNDLDRVTSSSLPIFEVFLQAINFQAAATFFTVWICFIYYGALVSCFVTSGRLIWAFSRDGGLPYSRVFAKIHPTLLAPVNATLLAGAFMVMFGLLYIASTTAYNSIVGLAILATNLTCAIPQTIVLIRGRRVLPKRYLDLRVVGGIFCNVFSTLYAALYTVLFCFPIMLPVAEKSMNYLAVVLVGALAFVTILWWSGKRHTFHGPSFESEGVVVEGQSVENEVEKSLTFATDTAAIPYIDTSQIGTFNLSSLNITNSPNTAFATRHEDELLPNRTTQVRHGLKLRCLTEGKEIHFSTKANGSSHSIDSFMYHFGLSGVMIVKDGAIRLERYQYGNEPSFRNQVQSATKSFVSTALGVAFKEKKIRLSDRVWKYIPELARTAYGSVPLRNLIDMTSGVTEPNSTHPPDLFNDVYPRTDPEAVLTWFKTSKKVAEPGEVAIGEPLEDWITKHIWEPAGMKYDGYMRTTGVLQVDGHGGLALTLQDMARFGLFVLDSFNGSGGPHVLAGWFDDISAASTSTTRIRAPGNIADVPNTGYQTGWWTMPRGGKKYQLGDDGGFAALGTYDQAIYIIPDMNTTIVLQSSNPIHYPDLFYYGQQFTTAASLALKK